MPLPDLDCLPHGPREGEREEIEELRFPITSGAPEPRSTAVTKVQTEPPKKEKDK